MSSGGNFCHQCGARTAPHYRVCPGCGTRLVNESDAATEPRSTMGAAQGQTSPVVNPRSDRGATGHRHRSALHAVAVIAAVAGIVGGLAVIAPQRGNLVALWKAPQPADLSTTSKTAAAPTTGADTRTPPPFFSAARRSDGDERASCGTFTVVRKAVSAGSGLLLLDHAGRVVKTFAPESEYGSFDALWCLDVTGDGVPELMIEEYTGGAHCCFAGTLLSLGEQITAAEVGGGDTGVPEPQRLDAHRAVYQLVGSNDALAYFEDEQKEIVPYACTSPFPRVIDYRDGKYVEAAQDFPTVLRADREAARREVSHPSDPDAANGLDDDCRLKGLGLRMLADSILLADWRSERNQLGLPADLLTWLDHNLPRVGEAMSHPGQTREAAVARVVAEMETVASNLGITPDALWTGIRSGCGGWTPCMNVEHFARDPRCFAEGNCIDFVGGQSCMGPQRTCTPDSTADRSAGDHYLVSSGGQHGVMIDFGVTADGQVARVLGTGGAEDAQLGAAMMARIASGAVPAWRELPRWVGDSYTTLAKLGGNFGDWSRSHPAPPSVERAFQRVQAAVAAGLTPDPADVAAMRPYADEFGSRFDAHMKTCDGSPLPAECQRTVTGHGVRVVVTRNTIIVSLSIEPLVGDSEASPRTARNDSGGTTPEQTVKDFYALVGRRELEAAWQRFSARYRSSLHDNYAGWASGFQSTESVEIVAASVVTRSADTATVAFTLVSLDQDNGGGTVRKTFQGTWDLVLTGGTWSLDKPRIRQASG